MGVDENKRVLERFDSLLGNEDLSELDELCTPHMVNHALAPDRPKGLAGTREFLETQGRYQMTNDSWDWMVVVAEGDYVVQVGSRSGEWQGRELFGFPIAPGAYSRDFVAMYRFEDGRIAERWAVRDDLSMLRQLGAFSLSV